MVPHPFRVLPVSWHFSYSFIYFRRSYYFLICIYLFVPALSCSTQGLPYLLRHVVSIVVAHELLVAACGIQFPDQGSNLGPLHWERWVLATGPPGRSPVAPLEGHSRILWGQLSEGGVVCDIIIHFWASLAIRCVARFKVPDHLSLLGLP